MTGLGFRLKEKKNNVSEVRGLLNDTENRKLIDTQIKLAHEATRYVKERLGMGRGESFFYLTEDLGLSILGDFYSRLYHATSLTNPNAELKGKIVPKLDSFISYIKDNVKDVFGEVYLPDINEDNLFEPYYNEIKHYYDIKNNEYIKLLISFKDRQRANKNEDKLSVEDIVNIATYDINEFTYLFKDSEYVTLDGVKGLFKTINYKDILDVYKLLYSKKPSIMDILSSVELNRVLESVDLENNLELNKIMDELVTNVVDTNFEIDFDLELNVLLDSFYKSFLKEPDSPYRKWLKELVDIFKTSKSLSHLLALTKSNVKDRHYLLDLLGYVILYLYKNYLNNEDEVLGKTILTYLMVFVEEFRRLELNLNLGRVISSIEVSEVNGRERLLGFIHKDVYNQIINNDTPYTIKQLRGLIIRLILKALNSDVKRVKYLFKDLNTFLNKLEMEGLLPLTTDTSYNYIKYFKANAKIFDSLVDEINTVFNLTDINQEARKLRLYYYYTLEEFYGREIMSELREDIERYLNTLSLNELIDPENVFIHLLSYFIYRETNLKHFVNFMEEAKKSSYVDDVPELYALYAIFKLYLLYLVSQTRII